MPFFSIVIPTLNEEKYISNLLTDLTEQTEQDFEVIIVDGNSEDRTVSSVTEFEKSLRLQIVITKKRNLAYQRNRGAKKAKGKYIIFFDADIHIKQNFLDNVKKIIDKCPYLCLLPIHIPHNATPQDEMLYNVISFFVEMSNVTEKPFSYGPCAIFDRQYFYTLGGYDESAFIYEDHEIVQRGRKRGVHAKLLQLTPVYFSMRRFIAEGRVAVLSKYLSATIYLLAKGKVDKEVFNYEMGGAAAYLKKKKQSDPFTKKVQKYFERLKVLIEQ